MRQPRGRTAYEDVRPVLSLLPSHSPTGGVRSAYSLTVSWIGGTSAAEISNQILFWQVFEPQAPRLTVQHTNHYTNPHPSLNINFKGNCIVLYSSIYIAPLNSSKPTEVLTNNNNTYMVRKGEGYQFTVAKQHSFKIKIN